jgi:hypothetical protein
VVSLDPAERCSLRSREADESLAATASTFRRWLLIEHAGPWGRDGLRDARLPEGLGETLRGLERRFRGRVLLIRRPGRPSGATSGPVRCFAVDTRDAWVGSATIDRIEDAAVLDPRDRTTFAAVADPVFVVCTHGRRDPCCAERGRPLAQALAAAAPGATWESTHVGGDRFAGNLVAFPHGLTFGRVEPDEAAEIARDCAAGRIRRLDRYRGRSRDPFHVQAAERAVRERVRAAIGIDDIVLHHVERRGNVADVLFETPDGRYAVRVARAASAPMRLTCHAMREESLPRWTVLEVRAADRG